MKMYEFISWCAELLISLHLNHSKWRCFNDIIVKLNINITESGFTSQSKIDLELIYTVCNTFCTHGDAVFSYCIILIGYHCVAPCTPQFPDAVSSSLWPSERILFEQLICKIDPLFGGRKFHITKLYIWAW